MAAKRQKFATKIKAFRQLGWPYIRPYIAYQLKLQLGLLQLQTPQKPLEAFSENAGEIHLPVFALPESKTLRALLNQHRDPLIEEADEIVSGKVRLFGGEPVPLQLSLQRPDLHDMPGSHWTAYKSGQVDGQDIKIIWEPGRFGWALTLARAYILTEDPRYQDIFWEYAETFFTNHPPNTGPQWASGQEVALRLIAFSLAASVFVAAEQPDPTRQKWLAGIVAAHASRIPPTLDYARAQNNNHLISEAVGLYTAASLLPGHPKAEKWKRSGWKWLHHALQTQITPDGTYIQHSTNYHRLMLQAALFARRVAAENGEGFPSESLSKLAGAARWLLALLDQDSGQVPNLGGNDGAYILPLTSYPYHDFRPIIQTAGYAFLGTPPLFDSKVPQTSGPGSEMTLWLGGEPDGQPDGQLANQPAETPAPAVLRLETKNSWATLRAAAFQHRPAHADQLHVDLWWHGINIAQDAGVYQYNAAPPWQNPLDTTSVHNTLTLNNQPQMAKAGRFLWLDWAQAEVLDTVKDEHNRLNWAVVQHDGYRQLNAIHRRTVSVQGERWLIRDQVWPLDESEEFKEALSVRLHWLLVDLPWTIRNGVLRLESEQGELRFQVRSPGEHLNYSLARAGQNLLGNEPMAPTRGWVSPTYAHKVPALSLAVTLSTNKPVTLSTSIDLPD